jgi:hypothetical protein
MRTIAWWRMNCGRVLGIYDGRLIEYEASTLAPLGLVVGADELIGRKVSKMAHTRTDRLLSLCPSLASLFSSL